MRVEHLSDDVVVYCGDCRDVCIAGTIDAVVTDPPYAIPTQVAQTRTITRNIGDLSLIEGAFRDHINTWKEQLGETGRIFVFCDGASYSVIYRAAFGKFNLASLVWDKKRIGMGREFRKRHELIIHGWGAETSVTLSDGIGYPDVIECAPLSSKARQHPAEKPVELLEALIRVCGKSIYDPFMGSGSTGVAAIKKGKQFVGCEIHEPYFDMACRRLNSALVETLL